MNSRLPARQLAAALSAAVAIAIADPSSAAENMTVRIEVEGTAIEISLPAVIAVGSNPPISITLRPTAGGPMPEQLRARLGMPGHGHWITAHGARPSSHHGEFSFEGKRCQQPAEMAGHSNSSHAHGNAGDGAHAAKTSAPPPGSATPEHPIEEGVLCLEHGFEALYPMPGTYRLRVWLDYPDGRSVKSGADLDVEPGQPIALRPAP